MKVFEVMLLVGVIVLIFFGTIFSAAMFQSISVEGNSTHEAETITSHMNVSVWIYIIGAIIVVAAIVMAFKLVQNK
jgi:hypothetical protein